MAKKKSRSDELFDTLRARGLRKRVARTLAELDGDSRRAGNKGEALARKALADLQAVTDDIRGRVLRTDSTRSEAAKKAARTRKRKAAARSTAAKKAAATRAKKTKR